MIDAETLKRLANTAGKQHLEKKYKDVLEAMRLKAIKGEYELYCPKRLEKDFIEYLLNYGFKVAMYYQHSYYMLYKEQCYDPTCDQYRILWK